MILGIRQVCICFFASGLKEKLLDRTTVVEIAFMNVYEVNYLSKLFFKCENMALVRSKKKKVSAFRYVFVSYCSLVSDTILQVSD